MDLFDIIMLVIVLLFPVAVGVSYIADSRDDFAHARCLRSIDRLERELFPEWFEDVLYPWEYQPGQRWAVNDAREINQHLSLHNLHNSAYHAERVHARGYAHG